MGDARARERKDGKRIELIFISQSGQLRVPAARYRRWNMSINKDDDAKTNESKYTRREFTDENVFHVSFHETARSCMLERFPADVLPTHDLFWTI